MVKTSKPGIDPSESDTVSSPVNIYEKRHDTFQSIEFDYLGCKIQPSWLYTFHRKPLDSWWQVQSPFDFANYELSAKPGSQKQMEGGLAALALGIMDEVAEAFPKSSPDTYAELCHLLWITIYGAACLVSRPAIESWLWNSIARMPWFQRLNFGLAFKFSPWNFGSRQLKSWRKCLQTPTLWTSWQLLKGILYGAFLTHCASPRGHLRAKSKNNRKVEPLEDYTDMSQDPSRLCPEADWWLLREDSM